MDVYEIDLDALNELEVNDYYGVKLVAYTSNPAIKIKGVALSEDRKIFLSEKKMQIAGALLVPGNIYRNDNGEEYYLKFTDEAVVKIGKQLMKNLPTMGSESIFTNEHTGVKLNAHIIEVLLIDSPEKQTLIKSQFGIDLPLNSIWINTQCEDADTYNYIVENDKVGFSIEGILPFKKANNKSINMSKQYKAVKFSSTRKRVAVKFEATELKEGEELTVFDEAGEEIPEWSGEITIDTGDGEPIEVVVEENEITSVNGDEGANLDEAIDEEAKLEETNPAPQIDLTPLIDSISELKEMVSELLKKEVIEDTPVAMSTVVKSNNITKLLLKSKRK